MMRMLEVRGAENKDHRKHFIRREHVTEVMLDRRQAKADTPGQHIVTVCFLDGRTESFIFAEENEAAAAKLVEALVEGT